MELQALRYAAMVSTLTFKQAVKVCREFLRNNHKDDSASKAWPQFWNFLDGKGQKMIFLWLMCSSYWFLAVIGKELITIVLWLLERGINIRCISFTVYEKGFGEVYGWMPGHPPSRSRGLPG